MRTTANQRRLGYADAQQVYLDAGWTPLPLPPGQKGNPPRGYTGHQGEHPTPRILKHWASTEADGNTALVMPVGVIGIDIDAYHGGDKTFRKLVGWYGSIPTTWWTTSRHDETGNYRSGIYYYGVPLDTKLVGKIDGGIEIIQPFHRYAVVWPSLHPEGRTYKWYGPDGQPASVPSIDDLPELPEAWLKGLTKKEKTFSGSGFTGSVDDWMAVLPEGHLHGSYVKAVDKAIDRLHREGGRYDTMVSTIGALVSWGAQDMPVEDEIVRFITAYDAEVGGERNAESEAIRALEGAISKFGSR